MSQNNIDIYSLVSYVISSLVELEASFGKTKLVKLLYLIDVEYYRLTSHTLTGFEWTFYHYGPYAFAINDILSSLSLDIPQETTTTKDRNVVTFKPQRDIDSDFEERASVTEKAVVDRVLRDWSLEELNPLLSYVYFHTEPMMNVTRGDILDFSNIKQLPTQTRHKSETDLSDNATELRKRFQEIKSKRHYFSYKSIKPRPRLDDVFWSSYKNIVQDEVISLEKGEVDLSDEFKGEARKQSENEK